MTATIHDHARRRRTAHGLAWWLTIGWWWAPAAWAGRVPGLMVAVCYGVALVASVLRRRSET